MTVASIDQAIGKLEAARDLLARNRGAWAVQMLVQAEEAVRAARYTVEHEYHPGEPNHGW